MIQMEAKQTTETIAVIMKPVCKNEEPRTQFKIRSLKLQRSRC